MKTWLRGFLTFSVLLAASTTGANPWGTQAALMAANTATNMMDRSWTPQYSNLKAYWRMNGKVGAISSGFVLKDYFSTSDATASATGNSFVAGLLEQAVSFTNGTYFTSAQTAPANVCSNVTIMFWVKWNATSATNYGGIMGTWNGCAGEDGWNIQQSNTSKKGEFSINTSAIVNQTYFSNGTPFDGSWRHVVLSMSSGGALKIYIDGAVDSNTTYSPGGGFCAPNVGVTIGKGLCGDAIGTGALLDEVAIFNTVLTDAEILTIYNRQKNGVN